ncbi:M15 family metallopeptidase [Actinomadura meridiana]|uniref:M15 family metallopeptidase n=1 Tax=Actinomadura meridiana TaxID=559626 RepID=A0ABP8CFZ3_9ACTN
MPGRWPIRTAAFLAALITAAPAAAACGGSDDDDGTASPAPTSSASESPSGPTAAPTFEAEITKVGAGDLKYSWRKGCPVPPSGLRLIKMPYWGMDDRAHEDGQLIVNAKEAKDVASVFEKLYDMRYPIKRMEPVDKYKASDFESIEADNTSAFNCRPAEGSTAFSQHAYGLAIDINPCENPYVYADGHTAHADCKKYKNRKNDDPGVIHADDKVVKAFASIGWGWGGEWNGAKDYQHFSKSGR